jgi:transposase
MMREQLVLFAPTLESRIPEDHPVRLVDEVLSAYDWSEWEQRYHGGRGQPPIPPSVLAKAMLYGFIRRIRSSRQLEYALSHNIDFIWLVEGHSIDHTTLCQFRTRFQKELKHVYRHLCRMALALGLIRLADVGLDGTRVLACNNRGKTLTAEKIQKLLDELEAQLGCALAEADSVDAADVQQGLFESDQAPDQLPPHVADLQQRQTRLKDMLAQARSADQARKREGIDPQKNPAQIPTTDPDSRVLPNKEGGYAPNYTPMAATDAHAGFIVSADVLASTAEQSLAVALVDDIAETCGQRPQALLGDGVYPTGENLQELDRRNVQLCSPLPAQHASPDNPAIREDPRVPVSAQAVDRLPINPQTKRFDKAAFVYVEAEDRYYCPQGRTLQYAETKSETRRGQTLSRRVYRSGDCSECPLLARCQLPSATHGRTVSRDAHEKRRQQHAAQMATPQARERYAKRFHTAEAPFAILKNVFGMRRFLLRGLEQVKTEWLWACTSFNLIKLVRHVARLRAKFTALAVAAVE